MAMIEIASIPIQLHRKAIKNLHISVLPPDGLVRVSAPGHMTDTAVRMAVIGRIPWIRKQQSNFASQARQSEREMVNGECHYLWGRRHRLTVLERRGRHHIRVGGGRIHLYINPGTSPENKARVVADYCRELLKERIALLLDIWQNTIGVQATRWGVKKMKTKWGSCNTEAGSIWLNLELARKPPECLEYILVHELVHLLERRHNRRFQDYMDGFLPDWRERRALLNSMPLAHTHPKCYGSHLNTSTHLPVTDT